MSCSPRRPFVPALTRTLRIPQTLRRSGLFLNVHQRYLPPSKLLSLAVTVDDPSELVSRTSVLGSVKRLSLGDNVLIVDIHPYVSRCIWSQPSFFSLFHEPSVDIGRRVAAVAKCPAPLRTICRSLALMYIIWLLIFVPRQKRRSWWSFPAFAIRSFAAWPAHFFRSNAFS